MGRGGENVIPISFCMKQLLCVIIYISKTYVAMDCLRVSIEHLIFLLAMATFWE